MIPFSCPAGHPVDDALEKPQRWEDDVSLEWEITGTENTQVLRRNEGEVNSGYLVGHGQFWAGWVCGSRRCLAEAPTRG